MTITIVMPFFAPSYVFVHSIEIVVDVCHYAAHVVVHIVHIRHHIPAARYAIPAILPGSGIRTKTRIRAPTPPVAASAPLVAAPAPLVYKEAPLLRETKKEREYGETPPDGKTSGKTAAPSGKTASHSTAPRKPAAREPALGYLHTAGSIKIIRHNYYHLYI